MAENIPDMEAILAQMRDKFIETAQEKLDRLDEILQEFSGGNGWDINLQEEFFREVHSLKGMGGTFQMPLVTKLCHSFEAFLEGESLADENVIVAAHIYVDRISDLIETGEGGNEDKVEAWLEGLPQKGAGSLETQNLKPIAFIVSKNSQQLSIVEDSLTQSDIEVVSFSNAFDAFEKSFINRPEIIVVAQDLAGLDGAEIIRSLTATKMLSKSKFAMICPDRRKALDENLNGVQLLSEKNIDVDILNFIAISITA